MRTTWSSFKKRLQPGAKLYILNIRRPWLSRHVVVQRRTRNHMFVIDDGSQRTDISLPSASFTRVVDDNEVELLAKGDGPLFDDSRQVAGEILAGQPYLVVRIVADVGED